MSALNPKNWTLSTWLGIVLGILDLVYIFLPFLLSIKHENFYQGSDLVYKTLGGVALVLIFIPETLIVEIIKQKFKSNDEQ